MAVGETLYARVNYFDENNVPDFHRVPTGEAEPLTNYVRMLRPTSLIRIPVRYHMTPFSTLRITKMNEEFGQIMPDNGLYLPYGNGIQDIFVELNALTPILDYSAFSLFEGTQNADKQVIVIRQYYHPEVLLVEGNQIIAWTPAILGAGEQGDVNTPVGDHRLSRFRGSRHMPDYPGVGFSMYFSGLRGYAVHDSYWWKWHELDKGFYGSAGCVNLPNQFFGSAVIEGRKVPLAEFMYRWASTNIDYDERLDEQVIVEWNDPGYKSGESTIRVVIVMDIDHLVHYPEHGSVEWETIIAQYKSFEEGAWFLPEYPWQGGHAPVPVHPSAVEQSGG